MTNLSPANGLYDRVISQINYEKRLRVLKRRMLIYSSACTIFVVILVPFFEKFYSDMEMSGFMQYVSLATSDLDIVVHHAGDYLMSLAESLPVLSFMVVASLLVAIIFSSFRIVNSYLEIRNLHFKH